MKLPEFCFIFLLRAFTWSFLATLVVCLTLGVMALGAALRGGPSWPFLQMVHTLIPYCGILGCAIELSRVSTGEYPYQDSEENDNS